MTLEELKFDVCSLLFLPPDEPDSEFAAITNRSLTKLYSDAEITATDTLEVHKPPTDCYIPRLVVEQSDTSIPLKKGGYSMRLFGKGTYTVEDGENRLTIPFSSEGDSYFGVTRHGGRIIFHSEFPYTVRDFTVYTGDYESENELSRISYPRVNLNLRGDYVALASDPLDGFGRPIRGCVIDGETLTLPRGFAGELNYEYYRSPCRAYAEMPRDRIDLPLGYENALCLLCAYYISLDIGPENAQRHMENYKNEIARMARVVSPPYAVYEVRDRWA